MLQFIRNLTIFVTPLVIFQMMIWGLGIYTGEAIHPRIIATMQNETCDYIWYVPDRTATVAYRMAQLDNSNAEMFIVGTSRSTQFRADFIDDPDLFENLSMSSTTPITHLALIEALIERVPNPQVIILEINTGAFQPSLDFAGENELDSYDVPVSENILQYLTLHSNDLFQKIVLGEAKLTRALKRQTLPSIILPPTNSHTYMGIRAIETGSGMRCDGSNVWTANGIANLNDAHKESITQLQNAPIRESVKPATSHFQYIERALQLAQQHGIQVIGYAPAFEPNLYNLMIEHPNYDYLEPLNKQLEELFTRYGFSYIDLADPSLLDADTEMFRDANHPGELGTLLTHIKLLETYPDILGKYSDLDRLYATVASADDPFRVFQPFAPYLDKDLLVQAQLSLDAMDWDKAIELLDILIESDPTNVNYNRLLLDAYVGSGQHEKADTLINNIVAQIGQQTPEERNWINNIVIPYYVSQKNWQSIIDFVELTVDPLYPVQLNYWIGHAYLQKDQLVDAKEYYLINSNANPEHAGTQRRLGQIYFQLGSYDEAIEHFTYAYEMDPERIENLFDRGRVYYELGMLDFAREDFDKYIELGGTADVSRYME